jgi:methylenetetrahydrofolate reductase (NADPH)
MAHITCSAHTREELARILDRLAAERADNVLALRGDPPGESGFVVAEGGFAHAVQLIELVRELRHNFSVGGACYPEKHQECADLDLDIRHLKAKVDAGADFLISQLFFDNSHWFAFLEKTRAAGIDVPVVPGLMPITSRDGIVRMTQLSGASIPDGLRRELDAHADDEDAIIEIGISHTTAQAIELLESGAPGIHFYTLNKSRATRAILGAIRRRLM